MLRLRDGNRQVQEYTDEQVFTTVYEQDSFVPVARIVQLASHLEQKRLADIAYETRRFVRIGESDVVINQRIADKSQPIIKIYHYHCNHLGTPQELTNALGEVVWLNYSQAWGGSYETKCFAKELDSLDVSADLLQPIRFQGQFFDGETNLHYNRFRYYDSDVGMFVSRDPIGLLGSSNIFLYAPNPVNFVDPYGLKVLYRSMSIKEYEEIISTHKWSAPPNVMSGKWFAESYQTAKIWGNEMGHGACSFMIVQITVPDKIAEQMHFDKHLDGIGSARYAELDQLNKYAKITWSKKIDANPASCKFSTGKK